MSKNKEVIEAIKRSLGETGRYEIKRSTLGYVRRASAEVTPSDQAEQSTDEMDVTTPIPFILSDESVDEYGTVFTTRGWKIDMFNANPIVTWQHPWLDSENPDDFIGTGPVTISKSLEAMFYPEPGETNSNTLKVLNKLKYRVVKSASVYAYAYEGRMGDPSLGEDPNVWYFVDQELIAWGIVPFPGNLNATAQRSLIQKPILENTSKARAMAMNVIAQAMRIK